jgi:uncharacterized protein YecE (DUF72 family)
MTSSPHEESPAAPHVWAGTSGWAYPTWKPGFYPAKTSAKKFLHFYASQLTSVEVNYTFRTLPSAKLLLSWIAEANPSFRFSFKAPQRITHFNRLRDCDSLAGEFFAALQPAADAKMLGLTLFQLPPNLKADVARLEAFLSAPAFLHPSRPKIAFEFRHDSWFTDEVYWLLRKHSAALCVAKTDDLTTPEIHTAETYTCFRLRRAGGYSPREIAAFAGRFRALAAEREVYVYFRHEDEPTGALNAQALVQGPG